MCVPALPRYLKVSLLSNVVLGSNYCSTIFYYRSCSDTETLEHIPTYLPTYLQVPRYSTVPLGISVAVSTGSRIEYSQTMLIALGLTRLLVLLL